MAVGGLRRRWRCRRNNFGKFHTYIQQLLNISVELANSFNIIAQLRYNIKRIAEEKKAPFGMGAGLFAMSS